MKKNFRMTLLSLILMTSMMSCNNEELFIDSIIDVPETDQTPDPVEEVQPEGEILDSTTPCDFALDNVQPNSTLVINCVMDLHGETITLPSNVTIDYEGGEIINGTLNFSDNSIIDGDLLNSTLEMGGSQPQIKDDVFNFVPKKWGIVEGEVPMETAKQNTIIIQKLIKKTKRLGIKVFKINKMDAYFYGNGMYNYNIIMPSDFHLSMTDNTHLRTFPSVDSYSTFLIIIQNVENVIVSGGNLHGDRDLYDRKDDLPPSHTLKIKTGTNVLIDHVYMSNATEDGLAIESDRFAYDPEYIGSSDIRITNCVFEANRRINLTITDGRDIIIENCTFIDGGINTSKSNAAAPSCNLNIEPLRGRNDAGELIEYQRAENIIIRNNKQYVNNKAKNSNAGEFLVSHGNGPIIIENNEMIDTGVSFHTVSGVIIRNNTITGDGIGAGSAESHNRTDFVFGNEVYGNTVKTNGIALSIAGNGISAHDNNLEGTVGISLGAGSVDSDKGVSNSVISNNIIKASSRGITSMNRMENVTVSNNTIQMLSGANFSLSLDNVWTESSEANFIIENNTVRGVKSNSTTGAPPSLVSGNSISILNNDFGDVQLNGASNIILSGNKIDTNIGENGILFYSDAPNSIFKDNIITTYPSKTPLDIKCIKSANNVDLSSSVVIEDTNTCIEK